MNQEEEEEEEKKREEEREEEEDKEKKEEKSPQSPGAADSRKSHRRTASPEKRDEKVSNTPQCFSQGSVFTTSSLHPEYYARTVITYEVLFSSCAAMQHGNVASTRPPNVEAGRCLHVLLVVPPRIMDCNSAPETVAEFRKSSARPVASPVGRSPRNKQSGGGKKKPKREIRAYAL